jgi:hypothetical protein
LIKSAKCFKENHLMAIRQVKANPGAGRKISVTGTLRRSLHGGKPVFVNPQWLTREVMDRNGLVHRFFIGSPSNPMFPAQYQLKKAHFYFFV